MTSGPVVVHVTVVAPTPPPEPENWFVKNTDWPALLLNVVVLFLAVYGVIQAWQANARAKELNRKLFRENRFKPFEEGLRKPRADLDATAALLEDVVSRGPGLVSFNDEIDNLGPMLFPALLQFHLRLADADRAGDLGKGWADAWTPHRDKVEAAYDIANDMSRPLPEREQAAEAMLEGLNEALPAMTKLEFDQRQEWGAPFKI